MESVKTESTERNQSLHMIKQGVTVGFPIMIGYLPVAIAYGVLAKQAGLTLFDLTVMSVFVFAGASQFMAVNMMAAGTGIIEIVIAVFILNFRQFVMSLSFMNRMRPVSLKWKAPLSLGLTDETFAVSSLHAEKANEKRGGLFYAAMFLSAYAAWIGGSLLGGILGEVIPNRLSQSMGIALYALFIGLLVPAVKKQWRFGLIAVVAILINIICLEGLHMSSGWAIVLGTIIGGFSGVFLLKEEPTV